MQCKLTICSGQNNSAKVAKRQRNEKALAKALALPRIKIRSCVSGIMGGSSRTRRSRCDQVCISPVSRPQPWCALLYDLITFSPPFSSTRQGCSIPGALGTYNKRGSLLNGG